MKVEVRKAVTINLGNYENVKIEVAFEREARDADERHKESPDMLYASVNEFVTEKIQDEIEKYVDSADSKSKFKLPNFFTM